MQRWFRPCAAAGSSACRLHECSSPECGEQQRNISSVNVSGGGKSSGNKVSTALDAKAFNNINVERRLFLRFQFSGIIFVTWIVAVFYSQSPYSSFHLDSAHAMCSVFILFFPRFP